MSYNQIVNIKIVNLSMDIKCYISNIEFSKFERSFKNKNYQEKKEYLIADWTHHLALHCLADFR